MYVRMYGRKSQRAWQKWLARLGAVQDTRARRSASRWSTKTAARRALAPAMTRLAQHASERE